MHIITTGFPSTTFDKYSIPVRYVIVQCKMVPILDRFSGLDLSRCLADDPFKMAKASPRHDGPIDVLTHIALASNHQERIVSFPPSKIASDWEGTYQGCLGLIKKAPGSGRAEPWLRICGTIERIPAQISIIGHITLRAFDSIYRRMDLGASRMTTTQSRLEMLLASSACRRGHADNFPPSGARCDSIKFSSTELRNFQVLDVSPRKSYAQ